MKERSDLTPTGFSKPFSCCGHFDVCNMGKGTCVYAETDPITMENCLAYRRRHSEQSLDETNESISDSVQEDIGQLSLFN